MIVFWSWLLVSLAVLVVGGTAVNWMHRQGKIDRDLESAHEVVWGLAVTWPLLLVAAPFLVFVAVVHAAVSLGRGRRR